MGRIAGHPGVGPRETHWPFKAGHIDTSNDEGKAIAEALPPVALVASQQFVGITTDGAPLAELFDLQDEGLNPQPIVQAALEYLGTLGPKHRAAATVPIDAPEWQLWINAFLTFPEHGVLLDETTPSVQSAALAVVAASLSATGNRTIRTTMQLNAALGELCPGYEDTLREYMYWFTIFGEPSEDRPWGWQLMGHHLDVNCFLVGGQMVLTPTFVGTEFEGHELFAEHIRRASTLMDSFDPRQRDKALLYRSILSKDLPPHLSGPVDGRHRAGAGRDNLVLPYEGIRGTDLTAGQRELLVGLSEPYLDMLPSGPREARLELVKRHLDETHLAWIGGWSEGEPFYYKVHSPVILIEYDNHSGVFLDNPEPEVFHVHSIVRTPNGGDYGKDLLAQHYALHH